MAVRPAEPEIHRFTVEEFHRLAELGLIPHRGVELLEVSEVVPPTTD